MPLPPLNKIAAAAIKSFKSRVTFDPIRNALDHDKKYAIWRALEVLGGKFSEEQLDYVICLLLLYKNELKETERERA